MFKNECSLCFFNIILSKEEIDVILKSFFKADEFEFCVYFVISITKQILDKLNSNNNKRKNFNNYDISNKIYNNNFVKCSG